MHQANLLLNLIREPDTRPIYEIAAEKYYLHGISKPGLCNWLQESRHYLAILDALICRYTREVNILKPVRGGGSVIGDLFLLWALDNEPGNYMQILQTDDEVSSYVAGRTILNLTRSLKYLMPKIFPRGNGEIELLNGIILYLSGPGFSNLQTKYLKFLHCDEPHMYKPGTLGEAAARLGDCKRMHTSKMLCISQGGPPPGKLLDDHDWFHHYNEGEINEWEAQCLHCSQFYSPQFTGMREDGSFWGVTFAKHKLPNGDYDVRKCLDTVHFVCPNPKCAAVSLDGPRIKGEWNRTGRYAAPARPYISKRSFHWEAVIMDNWRDLAENWLNACNAEARGNYLPKIQFYQKYRAIFMDEQRLLQTDRRFGRMVVSTGPTEWPDEYVRFMSVDRQELEFWVLICAWSKDGRVRRLYFGKVHGEADVEKLALDFKVPTYLSTNGKHSNALIDSAYEKRRTYAMCCRYGFIATQGAKPQSGVFVHDIGKGRRVQRSYSTVEKGDPEMGVTGEGMRFARVIQFVKHTMSSRVAGLIDKERIEHATDLGPEMERIYKEQMASRRRRIDYDPKQKRSRQDYFTESKNDHAQDCWNMQCLGATLARILSDDPMEEKEDQPPEP